MSFLRTLLASRPVRTTLDFGINENVRITKIDNDLRKRDGEIVKRNCFITFAKYNSKDEVIASSEFGYFNLDPTNDYVAENIAMQFGHLQDIVDALAPGVVIDFTSSYEDEESIMNDLKSVKGCKFLQEEMWRVFEEAVSDKVGPDSALLRVKVVTDSKGKYLQLPKETHIVEPIESDCLLSITNYEIKMRDKGLEAPTAAADAKGSAPEVAAKPKRSNDLKKI